MVRIRTGNLLESDAQTLVNTVNCVGIMGKGIALDFKKRFPDMFEDYVGRCKRGEVRLGEPYLYPYLTPPWVLNFPTKDHWRSHARLDDIVRGLKFLIAHYREWGITSLAVPPLGCGNGQLEWAIVGPTLYRYLGQLAVPVELYAPYGTPHEELQLSFLERSVEASSSNGMIPDPQWVQPSWVALVEVLKRVQDQPYHWPVGRTVFQKMAFVATNLGLPTGLQFTKGSYGPYSSDLQKLKARLESNGLVRERRSGQMYQVLVGPTFEDARKAYRHDIRGWEPIIEKTFDLFMRINTADQAELASTLFSADALERSGGVRP
ncbi:MAG: type II toxin-antitoxin system antitoxin DNA ADP-ribosyl glycohydrolase DarG, partial [Burkholderiales bacterium]